MKNVINSIALLAAGVALLAGCGDSSSPRPLPAKLQLHALSTDQALASDLQLPNNKVLRAGTPYLCKNRTNQISFTVGWENMPSDTELKIFVNGKVNAATGGHGAEKELASLLLGNASGKREIVASALVERGSYPFKSVEAQGLVPTPVPRELVGINTFDLQAAQVQLKGEQQVPIFNCG